MKNTVRDSCFIASIFVLLSVGNACSDEPAPTLPTAEEPPAVELQEAYHDKIRENPYPKADNKIYLNPCPLIVPQQMKTGKLLQFALSTRQDFAESHTTLSEAVEWCMYNPHKILENGVWYWRFRNIDASGSAGEWSDTYQFEITDDIPRFVTPPFTTFYNNLPHNHPRLKCYFDNELPEARQRASSHPEYNAMLGRARTALRKEYTTMGDLHVWDISSTLCNEMMYLHDAWLLTLDEQYLTKAHEIITQLLAYPVSDQLLFSDNFLATNVGRCYLKRYDLLMGRLNQQEKAAIEDVMIRIMRKYYKVHCGSKENHIFDNHFWQQNMRVFFQIALMLYDKTEYKDEIRLMMEFYYELWTARAPASGFNRDGAWQNGISYYGTNIQTLHYMPMLLSYICKVDFMKHPWYQNAGKALAYTWQPESKNIGFGDGNEKLESPGRVQIGFADFLARETGDPYAGWLAAQSSKALHDDILMRLYRIVRDKTTYNTTLPENAPKFTWHQDIGEVMMHSDLGNTKKNLALGFRSSIFGSGSHTVSNQNAFQLIYKGADVYRSTGYYLNFEDAHNLMSYRHSRAHNTILVNGIGQPFTTKGYGNINCAMGGQHITYCSGDASHAYASLTDDPMWIKSLEKAGIEQTPENGFGITPLTKYYRHIAMLHPDIVVIYDELEASEAVQWNWLLHSPTQFIIDNNNRKLTTTNNNKAFSAVTHLYCNDNMHLTQTDLFVVPPKPVYDPQYPNQWHMTANVEGCDKTRILAIIQVIPDNAPTQEISRNGNVFHCDSWSIRAEMDASNPPELYISSTETPTVLSYGSGHLILGGEEYYRKYTRSYVLYDEQNGKYETTEMINYVPGSTRTLP
ncbi:DUF4962 domain-containing protein [Bacteroides clarus]|uniref:DUF4962 domain-containing protein n=1 Tax=Bacteroides clarus TaxID=626929 RepID=UPI00266708A9|nr:DUF4962 domain-containing protein [Bacteroides clarus]